MISRLISMFQRSGRWTMDALRLLRAVQIVPANQRRQILLHQADRNNGAAKTLLMADKEINSVRYYGISRYLQEKHLHLPVLSSFLTNHSVSVTTEATETKSRQRDTNERSAKVPFMITKSMREDLETLLYSKERVRKMTPVIANIVLKHKLSPERYETEIESLVEQENEAKKVEEVQSEAEMLDSADSSTESLQDALPVYTHTENNGRDWFEVIEKGRGKDPVVVGLFAQEDEALSCQKLYEELAKKKNSRTEFITKKTRKP